MKNRPIPVILVAILFILAGSAGFIYHFKEVFEPHAGQVELAWVLFLRILAVACGILLLFRIGWARWLAIGWLAYHVIIGALNSISEMVAHIVLLIMVTILLFLPASSAYLHKQIRKKS